MWDEQNDGIYFQNKSCMAPSNLNQWLQNPQYETLSHNWPYPLQLSGYMTKTQIGNTYDMRQVFGLDWSLAYSIFKTQKSSNFVSRPENILGS